MIFKAEPNLFVRLSNKHVQRATGMKGLHFDSKGEFATENEMLINVMSQSFEVVKEEFPCKKCDFIANKKGILTAHYKKEHPKGGIT